MKKTLTILSFILCFAIIIGLGVGIVDRGEKYRFQQTNINGMVVRNLQDAVSAVIPSDEAEKYDAEQIREAKVRTKKYWYAASQALDLSDYQSWDHFRTLVSGLNFLAQNDKLENAVTREELRDIGYLFQALHDKEQAEAMAAALLEQIKPFE